MVKRTGVQEERECSKCNAWTTQTHDEGKWTCSRCKHISRDNNHHSPMIGIAFLALLFLLIVAGTYPRSTTMAEGLKRFVIYEHNDGELEDFDNNDDAAKRMREMVKAGFQVSLYKRIASVDIVWEQGHD